jgi:hypothetical protein
MFVIKSITYSSIIFLEFRFSIEKVKNPKIEANPKKKKERLF